MMLRKPIAVIIISIIILSILSACGKTDSEPTNASENSTIATEITTQIETQEPTTEATQEPTTIETTQAPTDEEKAVDLTQSYTTKYRDANSVEYPKFSFDYPDNWTVTQEDVASDREIVTLTNSEGAEVTFSTYFYGKDFNFSPLT